MSALDPVRFHFDEHVNRAIAVALRRLSIDVTTTAEQRLRGAADENHIEVAVRNRRTIVTNDFDFVAMHFAGVQHFGIVICLRSSRTIGEIIRELVDLHDASTADQMRNRLVYVSKFRN